MAEAGGAAPGGKPDRRAQFMNLEINTAIIGGATMDPDPAMERLFGSFTKAMGGDARGGGGIGSALESAREEFREEFDESVKRMEALRVRFEKEAIERRVELDAAFREGSDARLDEGIAIVDRYDFQLPRLTERLGGRELLAYAMLAMARDRELGRLFGELSERIHWPE